MGCRVVLEAASLVPKRVAGVVLIDGSRAATGNPDAAEASARAMVAKGGYAAFAENLFRQMFFKQTRRIRGHRGARGALERRIRS